MIVIGKQVLLLIATLVASSSAGADSRRVREQGILTSLVDPTVYDIRVRAFGNNDTEATIINVNLYMRSIQAIDDVKMLYKIQLTFRMQWLDTRLAYSNMKAAGIPYLTLATETDVWIPDLFFSNELEGHAHNLLKPNMYIRIFPNGEVLYSKRLTLSLSCPMNLKLFPMDTQTCSLRMASYGFTTHDMIFKWKRDDPVQVTSDLHLQKFSLQQFTTDYCDSHTSTGVYSCLRVDFRFRRLFSHYLTQVYIPSTMMVIIAWLSFWIDSKKLTARMIVSLITLLVLALLATALNATLPPVSYTTAIDVWTGMCVTFVFLALVICVFASYVSSSENTASQNTAEQNSIADEPVGVPETKSTLKTNKYKNVFQRFLELKLSKKIDVIARIAYPLFFFLFNIIYWSSNSSMSDE